MRITVPAKRVMRLMTRHGLVPPAQERETVQLVQGRTYQGTGNLADRAFHAESPDMLWVTNLTEFSIPADKAYLSPVIDCCDGMLDDHMVWYRDKRIKMEFGISIMDRRRKIGIVA